MDKNENICMNELCSRFKKSTSKFMVCEPPTKHHQAKACIKCGAAFFRTEDPEEKKFSSNNFKCPETGKEFFISQYSTSFKGSESVYKDKYKKVLVNPENDVPLVAIERDRGFGVNFAKFSPGTADGRERIKNHFASRAATKSKEVKEIKHTKNKEFRDANLGK